MSGYVDGFVLPIKKTKLAAYRKIAKLACRVWREHGALDYVECAGDDLDVMPPGFPRGIKTKPGETVLFAWIRFESRAHRDRVNKKVMADPRLLAMCGKPMPFDMRRMLVGGFKIIVT